MSGNGGVLELNTGRAALKLNEENSLMMQTWKGMNFTGCECMLGNGGGICVDVTDSGSVVLDTLTFTNCTAVKGGAVFATLASTRSIFTSTNCTFTSSSTDDGACLYILCPDGIEAAEQGGWASEWNYSDLLIGGGQFWLEETKEENAQSSWLVNFVYPVSVLSTDNSTTQSTQSITGTTTVMVYSSVDHTTRSTNNSSGSTITALFTVLCTVFSLLLILLTGCICQKNRLIQHAYSADDIQGMRDARYAMEKQKEISEYTDLQKSIIQSSKASDISVDDADADTTNLLASDASHSLQMDRNFLYPG